MAHYKNRLHAGRQLAKALVDYSESENGMMILLKPPTAKFGIICNAQKPDFKGTNTKKMIAKSKRKAKHFMGKSFRIGITLFTSFQMLTAAFALHAGETVSDIVKMENPAYKKHVKDIVEFKHKAHAEEFSKKYPQIFKKGCGECHHDDRDKPLINLKYGDNVKNCIECHKKPGEMPKKVKRELRAEKISPREMKIKEREYHAEALHDKCRGCHREARKKAHTRKPPITCSKCHTKDA